MEGGLLRLYHARIISPVIAAAIIMVFVMAALSGCASQSADSSQSGDSTQSGEQKLPVKVLILPKFEVGEMEGDFPGEAQFFYEEYLAGGDAYEIAGGSGTDQLYYKDGVALCLTGQGKVSSALTTAAVLSDERFDFSEAYILSVGCGGSAEGYGILGDVYVISESVDFDLGHGADPREMGSESETTWFHDESLDDSAVVRLDRDLTARVFERVKNTKLETTEKSENYMRREFPDEAWASRQPQVMRGTSVTSDNYWKGKYHHQNALLITETYQCEDPYAITEMEDVAVGQAVKRCGLLSRLIVLRASVNMDVFPAGVTPEMLWDPKAEEHVASEESTESIDIFETAMRNCFVTGKELVDAVLRGEEL